MAVIQFEWGQFDQWVDKACEYIADTSNPQDLRSEVCDALVRTTATLAELWSNKDSEIANFASVVSPESKSSVEVEKLMQDSCGKLLAVPQWSEQIKDTLHTVAPFMIEVLTTQGVFEEALFNEVPLLDFWYDSYSGLYKYSTESREEHTSQFS